MRDGAIGAITLAEPERQIATSLELGGDEDLRWFMADIWLEYPGSLNIELASLFLRLPAPLPHRHREQQLRRRTGMGAGRLPIRAHV